MKSSKRCMVIAGLVIMLCLTACKSKREAALSATQTKLAWEEEAKYTRMTEEAAAQQTQAAYTPTPEPIIHLDYPEYIEGSHTFVTDLSSLETAEDKTALGDYYQMNRLERPFTAQDMEYFGDLDLTQVDLMVNPPWFLMTFALAEDLRESGEIYYALELDLDADGRGDVLVRAALPPDSEWTTDGVQVFIDQDEDVGGIYPLHMEDPNPELTGYEVIIFDSGVGEDPDLAWVRRDPEESNQLQIAFKESLKGDFGFLWSAWADGGLRDPGLYDYNDQFKPEDAGSPSDENINYPVKMVPMVDSTCRSWYGMTPTGDEPGLCGIEKAPKSEGGGKKKGGPGMGFCVRSAVAAGCGNNPCLPSCPSGATCNTCVLP